MAENENLPPHPDTPRPPSDHPSSPDNDDSILDFGAIASVREGASGIIPLDQLPDPQSSPSLVSWTEVIRQHRETQPAAADAEPVKIDSVSDKDLLNRIKQEEQQRVQAPPATPQGRDTDKLGTVPIVTGEESGSAVQLGHDDQSAGSKPPSGSAVTFDWKPPSDEEAAAAWLDQDVLEALPIDEANQDDVMVAEAVAVEDDGEPIDLDMFIDEAVAESAPKSSDNPEEADLATLEAEPVESGGQSSILDFLVQDGGASERSASGIVDFGAKPTSGVLSGLALDGPASHFGSEADGPPPPFAVDPVSVGSGWLSGHDSGVKNQTMPSFILPEPNQEDAVDLYAEGPVSHDLTESGSLEVSDEQLKEAARKQRNSDSSAIDLSSRTSSSFDLDAAGAPSDALGDAPGLDFAPEANSNRPRKKDDSGIYRGVSLPVEEEPAFAEASDAWAEAEPLDSGANLAEAEPVVAEEEADVEEEPLALARPAAKPAGKRKRGGFLIGTTLGLVFGAGGLFGAYYFDAIPPEVLALKPNNAAPVAPSNRPTTPNANPAVAATAATPDAARRLLESGNAAAALETYKKCNQEAPDVLAGEGQAAWLVYLQKCAAENKEPNPDDAEVKAAQTELKAAVDKAKGNAKAEIDAARAYLWQGMIEETFQHFDEAEKIYAAAAQELPASKTIFDANLNRLQVVRPASGEKIGLIQPAHLLFAFTLLAADEPAPKTDEPAQKECGFAFWEAMLLAAKHDFEKAAAKIPEVKKSYAAQQLQLAGKNLNPLSDPGGQMIPATLDQLQQYWQLCDQLYKYEEAKKLVDQKKVVDALAALLAKGKEADVARAKAEDAKKLAEENLKTAEDGKKLAEDMLAMVGKSLKDAGVDDPKVEDGLKKLVAIKVDAETKIKSLAEQLEKAGVKEPDLTKAVSTVVASRDEADALVKGVRERLEKSKDIEANATKEQVLKAVDDAITRGAADAVVKLSQEKKEADAKLAKLEGEVDKIKKDAEASVKKAVQETADQKTTFEAKLADVRTPEQVVDVWLTALADKDRAANLPTALADAEAVLKNAGNDNAAKAKALAVKALVLRNQGKLAEARAAFEEAKKHPGFAKDQPWGMEIVKASEALDNPAAFVGIGGEPTPPPTLPKLLEKVENGLKLFPAETFAKDHARLLALRSLLKTEDGNIDAAAADAEAAIKEGAGADGQLSLGRVREKQGKFDEAEQAYREALKNQPEGSALGRQARLGLARVLLQRTTKPAAPAKDEIVPQPRPVTRNEIQANLLMLVTLMAAPETTDDGSILEAIKLADQLIAEKEYLGHILKADALAKLGRYNAALQEYSIGIKALRVLPKEYDSVLDRILALHPALQRPDTDLQGDKSLGVKHYGNGLELFRDGKFGQAEKEFIQSIRYDNKDARYMYFLGLSRWQQGKTEPAIYDFKAGAALELIGRPTARVLNSSLQSIQGPARLEIEKFRP